MFEAALEPMPTEKLVNELQSFGARLEDPNAGVASRIGGAGPSDHKAMTIDGMTVMVPVHTAPSFKSPYLVSQPDALGRSRISRNGEMVAEISLPKTPRFYALKTEDGIPFSKIAVLHGRDVLATTVLQSCVRYTSREKNLPVLRHRPVAGGGPHHRTQNPAAIGSSGESRG